MNTNETLTGGKAGLDNSQEVKKIRTIDSLLALLSQIDYKAELVPFDNFDKFSRLLASLKGDPLTEDELMLIDELVKEGKVLGLRMN
jgi:hypothetical protein